jgi:Zn-dependent protease with chaperone function
MYAQKRASAVRVTEKNFPEIYQKGVEYARILGLNKIPEIYIEQQNGILNAFASAVIGKRYIGLNAEIVDIAYMEHQDFDPVYFVLAHELAHHYYKHTSIKFILLSYVGLMVPVFGHTLSRAREYSCDRVAQLLVDRDCVREAMILSAGRHLYPYVDLDDYLQNARREGGFFLWLTNLMSTHPIALKRIAALADPLRKGGKLF